MPLKYTPEELSSIGRQDPSHLLDICEDRARRRLADPDPHVRLIGHISQEQVKRSRALLGRTTHRT